MSWVKPSSHRQHSTAWNEMNVFQYEQIALIPSPTNMSHRQPSKKNQYNAVALRVCVCAHNFSIYVCVFVSLQRRKSSLVITRISSVLEQPKLLLFWIFLILITIADEFFSAPSLSAAFIASIRISLLAHCTTNLVTLSRLLEHSYQFELACRCVLYLYIYRL